MSDEEKHSEREFYYSDELEFPDNNDFTETNYKRLSERENEGNSQEEIETFVKEQNSEKENSQRHENISMLSCHQIVTKIKIILDRKMR